MDFDIDAFLKPGEDHIIESLTPMMLYLDSQYSPDVRDPDVSPIPLDLALDLEAFCNSLGMIHYLSY